MNIKIKSNKFKRKIGVAANGERFICLFACQCAFVSDRVTRGFGMSSSSFLLCSSSFSALPLSPSPLKQPRTTQYKPHTTRARAVCPLTNIFLQTLIFLFLIRSPRTTFQAGFNIYLLLVSYPGRLYIHITTHRNEHSLYIIQTTPSLFTFSCTNWPSKMITRVILLNCLVPAFFFFSFYLFIFYYYSNFEVISFV